ncbi:hypothetical protein BH09VER1_BH09VER1_56300 [soil metagenome]
MNLRHTFHVLLAAALFLGGSSLTAGELDWKQTTLAMEAVPADKKTEAVYTFTNTSANPVEIHKVSTSCGCTVAELPKKTYGPGESGHLKVVFTFGERKGLQEKTILVQAGENKDVLTLRVNIADSVVVNPKKLFWKVGDPSEAQTFEIAVPEPATTKVLGAKALGGAFSAEFKEVESGKKYQVLVMPLSTARPQKGSILLEVNDPTHRSIYLPVEVSLPSNEPTRQEEGNKEKASLEKTGSGT